MPLQHRVEVTAVRVLPNTLHHRVDSRQQVALSRRRLRHTCTQPLYCSSQCYTAQWWTKLKTNCFTISSVTLIMYCSNWLMTYSLSKRPHYRLLTQCISRLSDCNFATHKLLFQDSYCHVTSVVILYFISPYIFTVFTCTRMRPVIFFKQTNVMLCYGCMILASRCRQPTKVAGTWLMIKD